MGESIMVQKGLVIGIVLLMVFSLLPAVTVGYHKDISREETYWADVPFSCFGEESASLGSYYRKYKVEIHTNDVIASDISVISNKDSQDISRSPPMDSPWPMLAHDIHHTGRSPYSTAENPGTEKWRFQCRWMESSPVIDNEGIIYFGDFGNSLYALYPNGTMKWELDLGLFGEIDGSTPAIDENGTIYIGSWDHYVHAINPNGTQKWDFCTSANIGSSPAIADDGTIYIGTLWSLGSGGKLYAIRPNGTEKWHFQTNDAVRSDPAIGDDGTVYFGSADSHLYALYSNGTLRWKFKTGDWVMGGPSIADDGTIYFGSYDDYSYALYPNGTLKWKIPGGTGGSPSIAEDGTVYIANIDELYAVYPNNGTRKWTFDLGGKVRWSSPAISAEGTIFVGIELGDAQGGELVAINPDGTEHWRTQLSDGMWIGYSPAIAEDGTIYVGSTHHTGVGYLHAVGRIEELQADANGPYYGEVGEPLELTGTAYGGVPPYSWHWDFGDGNTSELQNPTHVYTSPNEYTVILTVTDSEENVTNDTTWAYITTQTELDIDISKEGIVIKNTGDAAAYDVEWTIDITGGFLGFINKHLDGTDEELTVGEEITITLPFLLGLGPLTITATAEASNADSVEEAKDGFIILFFVILP